MGIFFTLNDFHFVIHDMDLRVLNAWITFRDLYGFFEGRNVIQLTGRRSWPHLEHWLDWAYTRGGADLYLSIKDEYMGEFRGYSRLPTAHELRSASRISLCGNLRSVAERASERVGAAGRQVNDKHSNAM